MKLNTHNNPRLTAVLLFVLLGALAVIVVEVRQQSASPSVVLAASPSVVSVPAAVPLPVGSVAREESDRDPFARPPAPSVLLPAPPGSALVLPPLPAPIAAPVSLRALPLPSLPVAVSRPVVAASVLPRRPQDAGDKKAAPADKLRGLRVSAIFHSGSRTSALVEGGPDGPQTVSAGDTISGLRVVGVSETEITLAGSGRLRTLPLVDAPEGDGPTAPPVQENAHALL